MTDRSFIAPTSLQVAEPLDVNIAFSDAKPTRPKEITSVELPYRTIHISNDGAVIDLMTYKRMLAGKESLIETVAPSQSKERGAFLSGLQMG